ncbi:MAG: tyrosine-type recombinase/integrase, partial [Rhodospirillales bacterium]|nr:tyrosine-type recombinase/integrase [Rhodospirillales bacterium]
MQALQKHGIDPTAKPFGKIASLWIEEFQHDNPKQEREYKQVVRRYFIPWFHDFKNLKINAINSRDIDAYKKWRKTYWTAGPGKDVKFLEYERGGKILRRPAKHAKASESRIRIEDTVFRSIIQYAMVNGYLSANEVPIFKSPKVNTKYPNARVAFTDDQIKKVEWALYSRLRRKEREHIKYHWQLIDLYWDFGIKTGARPPHEITSVKWKHITETSYDGNPTVNIQIEDSKTGRRPIVALSGLMWKLRFWRKATKFGADEDYVFTKFDGSRLVNPNKAFENLLIEAGATENRGKKLTQYSMRHAYITRSLQHGTNVYNLASQCGTSIQMIERYYSDVLVPDVAADVMSAGLIQNLEP